MNVSEARECFALDWSTAHLNHGSFGAVPRPVLAAQDAMRHRIERNPHAFLSDEFPQLLRDNRAVVARGLGADLAGLVFVRNTTEGVNAAVAAIPLEAGDEVVTTELEYRALTDLWRRRCEAVGAQLLAVPLAIDSPASWTDTICARLTKRTRVVYLSHVTSSTALVLPVAEVASVAREAGAITLIDGAHAPGQLLPLDIASIGADVYVGNLHKWAMQPRGSAFLAMAPGSDLHVTPTVQSWHWGAEDMADRFSWTGTQDVTPWLVAQEAEDVHSRAAALGWDRHARDLSRYAEEGLSQIGLPALGESDARAPYFFAVQVRGEPDELKRALRDCGVWAWVGSWNGATLLRVSTSFYSEEDDVDRLLSVLARRKW